MKLVSSNHKLLFKLIKLTTQDNKLTKATKIWFLLVSIWSGTLPLDKQEHS